MVFFRSGKEAFLFPLFFGKLVGNYHVRIINLMAILRLQRFFVSSFLDWSQNARPPYSISQTNGESQVINSFYLSFPWMRDGMGIECKYVSTLRLYIVINILSDGFQVIDGIGFFMCFIGVLGGVILTQGRYWLYVQCEIIGCVH